MKSTPENKVKKVLIQYLDSIGAFHYPASAGAFSVAGVPDRVGAYKSFFFGCECKAPGKKATALQNICRDKILNAGGAWFLIDGEESMKDLKEWVMKIALGLR